MEPKFNKNQIGAAWLKKTKTGDEYLSIRLEIPEVLPEVPRKGIFAFKNKNKKDDQQPDFNLVFFREENHS